ncbi:MAG: Hsp20/alpha crystallin family protein [Ectothiorhodospiraceae bacterium]|nr:Hsp20/alpha crystallin family protein [Chromatiales bacterium]MCP5153638.1 Hsp20/alpha crystallin family protein [Ectothiorhodospiraceae bacterium]
MTVVRYEPWGLLDRFQQEMNRVMGGYDAGAEADGSRVVTSQWAPAVDIREEANRYVLLADVPGVEPQDIDITMEAGVLTIKGERKRAEGEDRSGYRRVERAYGTFHRRFSLPDTADAERISASCKDGVLEVAIPKHEKLQPRRITVS